MHKSAKYQSIKKRKISNKVLENLFLDDDNNQNGHSNDNNDQNRHLEVFENDAQNIGFKDDSENKKIDFASPNFDNKSKRLNTTTNNNHMHFQILLWLLEY
jgi:hypothetical protein